MSTNNGIAPASLPAQIYRVEDAPLQPHEVVGSWSKAEYASKEAIPLGMRYVGMETIEVDGSGNQIKYRLEGGVTNAHYTLVPGSSEFATKIDKFTSSSVTHAAAGTVSIDLDAYQYIKISLEAAIESLILSGGGEGMTYRVKLTQANGGGHTLTLAPDYPAAGTNVLEGEKYIYSHIDNDGFIVRTRVYQVVADYQTVDIDSDIANGDLKPVYFLPDGVTPLLSIEDEQVDMLAITVTDTGEYQINLESSNM